MNRKTIIVFALTAILFTALGYTLKSLPLEHRDPSIRANVYYFFETAKGSYSGKGGNLITNIGERYVRNAIGFNNVTNFNYTGWISLSNVPSPLVTWTELASEVNANGFSRSAGTVTHWMNGTDYAYNVSNMFTASGTQQLQTAGLQWNDTAVSDNNLFSADTFTQTTFDSGDNLTITWVITWDAN